VISISINHVMWSVQVELIVIPLLPLGALLLRRLNWWQALVLLVVICLASRLCMTRFYLRPVAYFYCFYIGLLIPRMQSSSLEPLLRDGRLVILSLSASVAMYLLSIKPGTKLLFDAFVSAHIIGYVASSPGVAGFLRHRGLVWLGDISYSLYALAQIVLITIAYNLFRLPNWWDANPILFSVSLTALNAAIALPLAWASYRWIEVPGIAVGRNILSRLNVGQVPAVGPT